ncbi:bifunctional 2-polyprenyl-6-hydroxyphenol methylase/3-demethylubiquinol 3-O-methyltransferase UbiG [Aureimonas jatrophae]|jgi:2-polyprenyl-6-hydroxyphenyl methylase / 3-demethylubiquinone-9 3-methyltransferase|uniref:Ubiquinone biosynthesis O-methyltransferase n=1 Tax=Aureimonas jatrophae TaxID=1166073 RepID=A0A1H0I8G8_9HYPH|nr:bifunctional 2-polyprenyl-6-hydroxyphenol methylase/3-demethylubiquinol 3-O-methyltransferase UbiG [Aureimonas jatrophae]MBB3952041.1 2-polyprenyl-6-hydroxyphenyl methylase/3-demethylubiquinone-9 3-methyltransferase [Aureimonas jatrophae]SDO27729.1 3-demethylubiquinone-9 3-methyltransferase [Aureimonas jatrophae]
MTPAAERTTVDAGEVDRFSRLAAEWWNPTGKFKPLHKFNPVRLGYIREQVSLNFGCDMRSLEPFRGLRIVDIGCGGGLIAEPLARLGADVVGVDAATTNIEVAKLHAAQSGVSVDYRAETAEALERAGERFDVVLALEVVEHVSDVDLFLRSAARMVKPGGLLLVATINRTRKAQLFAIFGAEVVLRWLPRGTHEYEKLVRPEEIAGPVTHEGLEELERQGVVYHPLADEWRLSRDTDINYMMLFRRIV